MCLPHTKAVATSHHIIISLTTILRIPYPTRAHQSLPFFNPKHTSNSNSITNQATQPMDPTDNDDSDFDDTSSPPFDDELFDSPTHEQIETAARKARANAHVQDEDAAAARLLQASIERREREEGVRARERKRKRGEGDGVGVDGDAEGETDDEMGSGEDDEGGCGDAVGESDEEMGGEENAVSGSEDAVGESEDALGESEDAMGESDDAVGQDEDATGESDDAMGQDKDVEGERDNAEGESDDAVAQDKGAEKMKKDLERPPAISEKLTSVMKQRGTLMKQIVDDMQLQQKRRQQAKPETSTSPTKSPSGPSKPSSTFLQHLRQARKRDLKARVRAPAFHPRYPAYDGHARMMKDRKNQEWLLELEGGGREKVVKDERERIQTHKVLEDLEEAKRDEAERAERRGIRRGDREIAAQPPPTPRPTNLELSAPVPGSKGNPGADRRLSDDQGSRWRTPGRQRGQLNLDMTRIQTQFILSDHFIDDVNVMLDFTRSWSIEAFRPIYLSFKAAPENVGREIDSFRTLDWVDRSQWNWNVHIRSAKPYKPPEASYFGVNKAELVEEGLLPESCTKKGCTAGCPRSRTPSDYARSLMNGLNVRQKEKGGSKLGSVAPPKAAVKAKSREEIKMLDTMRMPPPLSRARRVRKGRPSVSHVAAQCPGLLKGLLEGTEPSPRPAPLSLSAANLSRIPDTTNLPSPESPLWRTGLLPDENKGSTPKLTLKIGLKPEPKPVEQSPLTKYFSTAGTPRVREDYFAKALPVSATQVTPPAVPEVKAIEAPEASVAQKNDKDVREFLLTRWKAKNKQSMRPKKQHNRVEEWQVDPDRH